MDFTLESNIDIDNGEVIAFSSSVVAGTSVSGSFESGMPVVSSDISGGVAGRAVEIRNSEGYVQWRYVGEDVDAWRNIVSIDTISGTDGREVELQDNGTYIQWRYVGEASWVDLIALADLKGDKGDQGDAVELQSDGTHIQWRYVGEVAWTNLVPIASLKGDQGEQGIQGEPGDEIELRNTGTYVQWRYVGGAWTNLIAVADLIGPTGIGVPTGGAAGQVLVKVSGTDYDFEWQTPAGAGDMLASVYDPTSVAGDAFARANHTGTQPISTVTGLQAALDDLAVIPVEVTTAYNAAAKVGTTTGGAYVPAAGDVIEVTFVNGSNVNNPTLDIDGSGAVNIRLADGNVTTATMALGTAANSNIKIRMWFDGTYWQTFGSTDNTNTTYSEITTAEIDAGTASTARAISGRRAQYLMDQAVSDVQALSDASAFGISIDEDDMTSNLSTKLPTQQSVKAYVDNYFGSNSFIYKETPTGTIDSSNATFTTSSSYVAGSLQVFVNGIAQAAAHITETNPLTGAFALDVAPTGGSQPDVLHVNYQSAEATSGNADTVDGFHANAAPTPNTIPVLDASGVLRAYAKTLLGKTTAMSKTFSNNTSTNVEWGGSRVTVVVPYDNAEVEVVANIPASFTQTGSTYGQVVYDLFQYNGTTDTLIDRRVIERQTTATGYAGTANMSRVLTLNAGTYDFYVAARTSSGASAVSVDGADGSPQLYVKLVG